MSPRLRLVWLVLGLGTFVTLVVLFFLPTGWTIERSTFVDASPAEIFPLVVDLDRWDRWSPWRESDYEELEFYYPGPRSGVGAIRSWDTETTGAGRLEIVAAEPPRRIVWETELEDGHVTTRDELVFERTGGRTRVVWRHSGNLGRTLLGRLSLPVIESSMTRDIERGLDGLESAVRAPD